MYIHVCTHMYFTRCSKLAQLIICQLLILISQSFSRIFSFIHDNFVCAYSVSYYILSPPPLLWAPLTHSLITYTYSSLFFGIIHRV